jgi:hypothetical protein
MRSSCSKVRVANAFVAAKSAKTIVTSRIFSELREASFRTRLAASSAFAAISLDELFRESRRRELVREVATGGQRRSCSRLRPDAIAGR